MLPGVQGGLVAEAEYDLEFIAVAGGARMPEPR